jgi:hypothetical protein
MNKSRFLVGAFVIFHSISTFSQKREFSFSVGVSNNGQMNVDRYLYDGFTPSGPLKYKENKFKLDLWGEAQLKGDLFLTLKGGFGKRVDSFDWDDQGSEVQRNSNWIKL